MRKLLWLILAVVIIVLVVFFGLVVLWIGGVIRLNALAFRGKRKRRRKRELLSPGHALPRYKRR